MKAIRFVITLPSGRTFPIRSRSLDAAIEAAQEYEEMAKDIQDMMDKFFGAGNIQELQPPKVVERLRSWELN